MTKYTEKQLKRLHENGYTVIRIGKHFALVRNYSKKSSISLKKYFSFYGLIKISENTQRYDYERN